MIHSSPEEMVHNSIGVVTVLLPHIGYKKCLCWCSENFTVMIFTTQVVWGFQKKKQYQDSYWTTRISWKVAGRVFCRGCGCMVRGFFHITERRRWNWCFHPLVAMWVDWQRGEIIIANPDSGLIGVEPFLCTTCMACMCFCSRRYTV